MEAMDLLTDQYRQEGAPEMKTLPMSTSGQSLPTGGQ